MRPGPGRDDARERRRLARTAGARAVGRHDRNRHAGHLAGRVRLPPFDDAGDVPPVGALNLERRPLRQEAGLIGQAAQMTLHEVRAEVVEQEESAQQEEDDDQRGREEADEDVEHQLAAHPPEQVALPQDDQPEHDVHGADRERETGGGVDDAEKRRHGAERESDRVHREPQHDADDDHAAGQRAEQRVTHAVPAAGT